MRVPKSELTPGLRRETDALLKTIRNGTATADRPLRAERQAYYDSRAKSIFIGVGGGAIVALLIAGLIVRLGPGISVSVAALALLGLFTAATIPAVLYTGGRLDLAPDELDVYLPTLDLSPPERLFAETLARAYERDSPFVREEVLPALRTLCAEWDRLDVIAHDLIGGPREGEVEALCLRLERTADPIAREALVQSLATAETRASSSLNARNARERLEAHRETILQSAHAIAETAARANGDAPDASPDLADLRANVARAARDVAALEDAVGEMRAL